MTAVAHALRFSLALLLLVSAAAKAVDLPGMAGIVGSYGVLPAGLTFPAALALTLAEATVGCLLVAGKWRVRACLASAALHAVYFVWSGVALGRGLAIANCGCFGVFWPRPLSALTPVEDGALVALSLALANRYRGARQ